MVAHSKLSGSRMVLLRTAAAKALPAPKKTGNPQKDEDIAGRHRLLQSIVDDLAGDGNHVVPTYNFIQERKAVVALTSQVEPSAEMFSGVSTFAGLDPDFKVQWLVAVSDMSADDILLVVAKDPDAIDNMVQYATQISPKQKVPAELLHVEVMKKFLDFRENLCGRRLRKFKNPNGGPFLRADGSIDWESGSFKLEFDKDGVLVKVIHITGEEAEIAKGTGMSNLWQLVANWDDYNAHLVFPPNPPFKLVAYFRIRKGPNAVPTYVGKPKLMQADVERIFKEWEDDKRVAKSRVSTSAVVKKAVADHKQAKAKAAMQKARVAAQKAIEEKKKRGTIVLKR